MRLDMRGSAKMLKMTISMATSKARMTSMISSQALQKRKDKRGSSSRRIGNSHQAMMTFSEPHNILNTKIIRQRTKIPTLETKTHINGHNRNKSHKIILADLLMTMHNMVIMLSQQKKMMIIIEENMKNGCGSKLSKEKIQSLNGTNLRIIDTRLRQMQKGGLSEKRSLASILRAKTLVFMKRIEHIIRSKEVISSHTSSKDQKCLKSIETIKQRNSMASIKK